MNKLVVTCTTGFFALALLATSAPARSEQGRAARLSVNDTMVHSAQGVPSDVEQQWRRRYGRNPPSDREQRWRGQHRGYRNVPSDVEQRRRRGGAPSDLEQAWRRYGDGGPIPSDFEQKWRRGWFD